MNKQNLLILLKKACPRGTSILLGISLIMTTSCGDSQNHNHPVDEATIQVEDSTAIKEIDSIEIEYFTISDPDGYSNLRTEPNGEIIKRVFEADQFEIIGEEGGYSKVKLADSTIGFIHSSRVVPLNSGLANTDEIESHESTSMTEDILTGTWTNDNPWQGKGTERYKEFETLEFRSDYSVLQDGRLIGTAWNLTEDKEGRDLIEFTSSRNNRKSSLTILNSTETNMTYRNTGGNSRYDLTKK